MGRFRQLMNDSRQQMEITVAQALDRLDQLDLGSGWCLTQQAPSRGREPELDPPSVIPSPGSRHQAALHQPTHHHGNRTLMGQRPLGQLVQGLRRALGQGLQHKQLGPTDSQLQLSPTGGEPDLLKNSADILEDASGELESPMPAQPGHMASLMPLRSNHQFTG
jgi:hypothetical protein